MRINHNVSALNAWRQLSSTDNALNKSLERLSSGMRINRASDDAAGLAISEKMRAQISGLNQASRNAQDGISMIQTAEGALNETHSILQRMRELAVQSSNDTNTLDDRKKIQQEMDELAKEVTRISNTTEFNTKNLLAGTFSGTFHIGANEDQTISASIGAMDATTLGVTRDLLDARESSTTISSVSAGTDLILDSGTYTVTAADGQRGASAASELTVGSGDQALAITVGAGSVTVTFSANTTYSVQDLVDAINDQQGDTVTASISSGGKIDIIADAPSTTVGILHTLGGSDVAVLQAFGMGTATTITSQEILNVRLTDPSGSQADASTILATATQVDFGGVDLNVTFGAALNFGATIGNVQIYTSQASLAAIDNGDGSIENGVVQGGIDIRTQDKAESAITTIDGAIQSVSDQRSKLGAIQNRLEHTINNLGVAGENLTAAESRIRDVDMAQEMMEFTKKQILTQAGTAMLAQANMKPQSVLQLLG